MARRILRGHTYSGVLLLMVAAFAAACGSSPPVVASDDAVAGESPAAFVEDEATLQETVVPTSEDKPDMDDDLPELAQDVDANESDEPVNDVNAVDEPVLETYPEDEPAVLDDDPIAVPFALEPANAQLARLPGWVSVDSWYSEPLDRSTSADCAALTQVLELDQWGVITTFWLQEGTELFHHTAELNNEENVAAYLRAVADLANCGRADVGGAAIATESFIVDPFTGVTLDVAESASPTWLYEGGRATSFVVMSRDNVVSILQIVPTVGFDMAEFEILAHEALETLDAA